MKVKFFFTIFPVIVESEFICTYFKYYWNEVLGNRNILHMIEDKYMSWQQYWLADNTGNLIQYLGKILFSSDWWWLERENYLSKQLWNYLKTIEIDDSEDYVLYMDYIAMSF